MRQQILLNDKWLFTKEGHTETVNLPHTWNASDGQGGDTSYYRGRCCYRKEFECPKLLAGQRVYVEFRGVNSSAAVRINGVQVAAHDGGYSTFRAEITKQLAAHNVLEVEADNTPNDYVYPQRADFTFYGGIYRDVYLIIVDESHFDMDYFGGNGFMITPSLHGESAEISFRTFFTGKADRIVVAVEGVGETELCMAEEDKSADGEKHAAGGTLFIPKAHRWNGRKDPYLYTATATLYKNGKAVDSVTDRFGCREYRFDSKQGFFLNGKSYPLHGVSRHQDRLGVGNALTKEMHEEDMELILSMGANSIRLAHYQHDQYFYDLCDEKGIVVWAEIPYITVHMENGRENTIQQMKELITQNYNHASIICWALSNEISLQGVTEDLMENHKILNDLVHSMDNSRVSAMANLFMLETDSPLVQLPDIRGYNLYYGWYVGEMEDNDKFFDDFHAKYPDTVIGLTEYGADSVIRLQSPKPQKGDYTESYQALYHEHMLKMFSTRPYLWGTFVWNMFEFGAAGRDDAGDPGKNHKGLITFDRKQKKDAYYIYKAWWSDEPFVHLCGSRYRDRIEPVTEVKVYSNQPKVALYVDGQLLEEKEGSHVFCFQVPIKGVHQVRAESGNFSDTMEIRKTSELNPDYFVTPEKVRNWFDEPDEEEEKEGYLSLNSTMAEIQAVPEGAALLEKMMSRMKGNMAGGMGEGVEIPESMQKMIARQPLKKLLQQGGIELDGEVAVILKKALSQIKKG